MVKNKFVDIVLVDDMFQESSLSSDIVDDKDLTISEDIVDDKDLTTTLATSITTSIASVSAFTVGLFAGVASAIAIVIFLLLSTTVPHFYPSDTFFRDMEAWTNKFKEVFKKVKNKKVYDNFENHYGTLAISV
ncbi:hypothetical protein D4R86_00375, partial [bacterium]